MLFDFVPVYPRHDLLVEISLAEMAMDHLAQRSEQERANLRPRLEHRIDCLRDELHQLAA